MSEYNRGFGYHTVYEGLYAIRLNGGPWDGQYVGIMDPHDRQIVVNGPRNGDHRIWIRNVYSRREDRWEFVETETTYITAYYGPPP
jgi:hypothetical protein